MGINGRVIARVKGSFDGYVLGMALRPAEFAVAANNVHVRGNQRAARGVQ